MTAQEQIRTLRKKAGSLVSPKANNEQRNRQIQAILETGTVERNHIQFA